MNKFSDALFKEKNKTTTENGAVSYRSTKNDYVDLFSTIGNSRGIDITSNIEKCFNANPELTSLILMYARDVRQGLGERQVFRDALVHLAKDKKNEIHIINIVKSIPELGRFDDLLVLLTNDISLAIKKAVLDVIKGALANPNQKGLCAKWMPRKGPVAKYIYKYLDFRDERAWRQYIVANTKVVEQNMCAKDWGHINYEQVPSRAMSIYKNAFKRNDFFRFSNYLKALENGTAKLNSSVLYPYEIIKLLKSNKVLAEKAWNDIPEVFSNKKIISVVDTSGSMESSISSKTTTTALDVAVSLGLLTASKLTGAFKDHVITFSVVPSFIKLSGSLSNRVRELRSQSWSMNTNYNLVHKNIINKAIENKVPQSDMPDYILVISDMQFDESESNTNKVNHVEMEKLYAKAGYVMPKIIYWHVSAGETKRTFPATTKHNVIMLSGFSYQILLDIIANGDFDAYAYVKSTVCKDRYMKYLFDEGVV
jgi:hypothetical protein